jgi:hypothetical protein
VLQQELFGVSALSTGLTVVYHRDVLHGGGGELTLCPSWSKGDPLKGRVSLRLDECAEELVPDLIRAGWEGWLRDPERGMAYRCKKVVQAYEHYYQEQSA